MKLVIINHHLVASLKHDPGELRGLRAERSLKSNYRCSVQYRNSSRTGSTQKSTPYNSRPDYSPYLSKSLVMSEWPPRQAPLFGLRSRAVIVVQRQ